MQRSKVEPLRSCVTATPRTACAVRLRGIEGGYPQSSLGLCSRTGVRRPTAAVSNAAKRASALFALATLSATRPSSTLGNRQRSAACLSRRHHGYRRPKRLGVDPPVKMPTDMVTLVLLPGMDGTGDLFEPFIAALGGEFDVKVVRYPSDEPLGYAELEAFARAALPAEGPFVLVGESFSGPITVALAASASQQLKGLVLCCTFVRNPRPLFAGLRSVVGLVPVAFAPVGVLSGLLLGRFSTVELRAALARSLAKVAPSALRARLAAVLNVDVSSKLSAVKAPTLYLRASNDRLVPPSACALISRLAPRTRVVELDGPHFLLQAVPVEAARVVRAFVHDVRTAALPA